mgnify:CR=1 FL=1
MINQFSMLMNVKITKTKAERYFAKLKEGDEMGLNYFYNTFFSYYVYRANRYVKEDAL